MTEHRISAAVSAFLFLAQHVCHSHCVRHSVASYRDSIVVGRSENSIKAKTMVPPSTSRAFKLRIQLQEALAVLA